MIKLNKIDIAEMPAEFKLLKLLDEIAPENGQLYIPASELAKRLQTSETSARRHLKRFRNANILKIADKIYLNPDVFDLSIGSRKVYDKVQNKVYND